MDNVRRFQDHACHLKKKKNFNLPQILKNNFLKYPPTDLDAGLNDFSLRIFFSD